MIGRATRRASKERTAYSIELAVRDRLCPSPAWGGAGDGADRVFDGAR